MKFNSFFPMWTRCRSPAAWPGLAELLLFFSPARALINPNFTPADLVRSANRFTAPDRGVPAQGALSMDTVDLSWTGPDGTRKTQRVVVTGYRSPFEPLRDFSSAENPTDSFRT